MPDKSPIPGKLSRAPGKARVTRATPAPQQPHTNLALAGEAEQLQRSVGNQAIGRLVASGIIQRNGLGEKTDSIFENKTKIVMGSEKRSSAKSRQQSEDLLNMEPPEAAERLGNVLRSGLSALASFERVTMLIAGQPGGEIIKEYRARFNTGLNSDLQSVFAKSPGPWAYNYLSDMLHHNGIPSLRAQLYLALGEVDKSGSVTSALGKIPKLGDKIGDMGDSDRMQELLEEASPEERKSAWNDPFLKQKLTKWDDKFAKRIDAQIAVDEAEEVIADKKAAGEQWEKDQQRLAQVQQGLGQQPQNAPPQQQGAPPPPPPVNAPVGGGPPPALPPPRVTQADRDALSQARDTQLGIFTVHCVKTLPAVGNLVRKGMSKFTDPGSFANTSFDAKKWYEFVVQWKSKANEDDIAWIKKPNSKFKAAVKVIPTNGLTGLGKSGSKFVTDFLDIADTDGNDTQVQALKGTLARQKEFVGRKEKGGWLSSRLPTLVSEKRWQTLETEVKLLTADQRKKILDEYDIDPATALEKLEKDLYTAGLNKEERARVKALFNTSFGDIGDKYAELWELVDSGKKTRLGAIGKHLAPSKIKNLGKALKGKDIGKSAYKIIMALEDNEHALVRQDKDLLARIKEHSEDKVWQNIMDALGMKDINDQLQGQSPRIMVEEAKTAAEVNPKRWAMMLDDAIEENKIGSGVSAGRDKAQLMVIATQAQNAAYLYVQKNPGDDEGTFLRKVLVELNNMEPKKIDYLIKRVPEVYNAFERNVPIPVSVRMERAKHEGFGVGSHRKMDRQKLVWAFKDLRGKQLLDEWSNVEVFRTKHQRMKQIENEMVTLQTETALPLPDNATQAQQQERTVKGQKLNEVQTELGTLHDSMQGFTIGINEARRADLKSYGLNAQDRVKIEAMVTDKLIEAMDDDPEVQLILDEISLPYDDFMQGKMKGVDALEMQRYLDTTRQWHLFSTKGSQLSEATRNVKGQISSTEDKQRKARKDVNLSEDERKEKLEDIRSKGGKSTEKALSDRNLIQARFRDMQKTFRDRAMLLFKLIALGIVTGLTMGVGGPLMIGIQVAVEIGLNMLEALYKYYVLGETDLKRLALEAALGMIDSTVRILTMNVAMALNASVLNPANMLPGSEWLGLPVSKSIGKIMHGATMMLPNHLLEQYMQTKELETVIEEGEGTIVDSVVDELKGQLKGVVTGILMGGIKEGRIQTESLISGEPLVRKGETNKGAGGFGQAYTDRLAGGANTQEQERMWGRYEKQKKKDVKKQFFKVVKGNDKETKKAEKKKHKDEMKEMRGKEERSGAYKQIKERLEPVQAEARKLKGEALIDFFNQHRISCFDMMELNDEEKGKVEEMLLMRPGDLEKMLLSPGWTLVAWSLRASRANFANGSTTLKDQTDSGAVNKDILLALPERELKQIAIMLGIEFAQFQTQMNHVRGMPMNAPPQPPQPGQQGRQPPQVRPRGGSTAPPMRPPPPAPTYPRRGTK